VRALIGQRAELLAYCHSAMHRDSFDEVVMRGTPPYRFIDRFTGDEIELQEDEFKDLCRLQVFDWLEQAPRSGWWHARRDVYVRMAETLGGSALEATNAYLSAEVH
jgi:hypothetical protein